METGKDLVTEYGYDKDQNLLGLRTIFCDEMLTNNRYTYDGTGNRLTERQVQTLLGIHRETYEYDGQASYLYDGFSRMCEVRMDDRQIQRNRYDTEGLRHEMEENGRLVQFLYSGEELEAKREEDPLHMGLPTDQFGQR